MGIEKRKEERIIVSGDVLLNHRDRTIYCKIENISHYGAYLKLVGQYDSDIVEIGDQVTFSISIPNIQTQNLVGQILRISVEVNIQYLAVYFFKPYDFE